MTLRRDLFKRLDFTGMCLHNEHMATKQKETVRISESAADARSKFGALLRELRTQKGLSCTELSALAGKISRTTLATIERGQRQAGAQVSERLANALNLRGEQRYVFLTAALKTTAGEVLPNDVKGLDPDYFAPICRLLKSQGITTKRAHDFRIRHETVITTGLHPALSIAAKRLADHASELSKKIQAALDGTGPSFKADLTIESIGEDYHLIHLLPATSRSPQPAAAGI